MLEASEDYYKKTPAEDLTLNGTESRMPELLLRENSGLTRTQEISLGFIAKLSLFTCMVRES